MVGRIPMVGSFKCHSCKKGGNDPSEVPKVHSCCHFNWKTLGTKEVLDQDLLLKLFECLQDLRDLVIEPRLVLGKIHCLLENHFRHVANVHTRKRPHAAGGVADKSELNLPKSMHYVSIQ